MQRRQRHLGGADQVEVVLGQAVDLLLGVGQEAGPVQRLLADEHRRDHRLEPLRPELLERVAHERQLEQHEVAAQVGEARARQPRRALHVDPRTRELEVVAAGLARLADLLEHRVLVGSVGRGQVGQRREHRVALGARPRSPRRSARGRARRAPRAARAPRASAAPCGRGWRGSARPGAPRARSVIARQRSSSSSTRSSVGDRFGAAPRQRRADRVRLAADQVDVENAGPPTACAWPWRIASPSRGDPWPTSAQSCR